MGALGNTPRSTTVVTLEARKSYALGLQFLRAADDVALDLTGATVRFVVAAPQRQGGAVVLTKTATAVNLPLGLMQLELQAADLDLAEGEYPFSATLVSANGYSSPLMKGVFDLRTNPDPATTGTYTGINPSTNLAVYVEQGDVLQVRVAQVDGMYVVVSTLIDGFTSDMQTQVDNAAMEADNAQAWANAASTSASNASSSASAAAASETSAAASASSASASKSAAEQAATDAQGVAANTYAAAQSASDAAASATAASGSATAASTSATNAAGSATSASTSATNAATSEANAAQSAADAESVVTSDLDPVIAGRIQDPAAQSYAAVTTRIGSTAPAAHSHDYAPTAHTHPYAPAVHTHSMSEVNGLNAALASSGLFRGQWTDAPVLWSGNFEAGTLPTGMSTAVGYRNNSAAIVAMPSGLGTPPSFTKALRLQIDENDTAIYSRLTIVVDNLVPDHTGVTALKFKFAVDYISGGYEQWIIKKNGVTLESATIAADANWVDKTIACANGDTVTVEIIGMRASFQATVATSALYLADMRTVGTATPYNVGEYVVYSGTLYRSAIGSNSSVPGANGDWIADPLNGSTATTTAYAGSTNLSSTNVEAALDELDTEKAALLRTINAQIGTAYTLALADVGKLVTLSNAAAIALTVPTNATAAFAVGTEIDLAQLGAGQVTVAGAAGVTVNGTPGLKIRAQYGKARLTKIATDTWLIAGDLAV